jgi:hypothetical protein
LKKSIILYQAWGIILDSLPDAKAGKLIKMIVKYGLKGEETKSDDETINAIFEMVKEKLNEDSDKYKAKKERMEKINAERKRNEVVTKSSRNRNEVVGDTVTVTDTVTVLPKGNMCNIGRFTPPTLQEVQSYMSEKGVNDPKEAEKFVDFYECKGWMVGKNKMKDWKAAVRNWIKGIDKNKKTGFNSFEGQREYDYGDLERRLVAN